MTEEYAGLFLVVVVVVVVGRIGNKWGSGEEKNDPIVAVIAVRLRYPICRSERVSFLFLEMMGWESATDYGATCFFDSLEKLIHTTTTDN